MRGRGLKHILANSLGRHTDVAPHAGAWIETASMIWQADRAKSPLMRGRGLKQSLCETHHGVKSVAPHAGAWIETMFLCLYCQSVRSPLMRGRGLKLLNAVGSFDGSGSPLMRGRGLKPLLRPHPQHVVGRPSCGGVD